MFQAFYWISLWFTAASLFFCGWLLVDSIRDPRAPRFTTVIFGSGTVAGLLTLLRLITE